MLREFFLYVSPLFAVYFLPDDYSVHFLLYYVYVRVLYFFTDKDQLTGLDYLFSLYHESLSHLYSERSELATVHYHSHLLSQVRRHGALGFTSCFARESYLGHTLKWCKGKTHLLSQFATWYEVSQNLQRDCSFSIADVFHSERFSVSFLRKSFITSMDSDFNACLKNLSASVSDCVFYSGYYRGLACLYSVSYSRTGRSISHFVSVRSSSCINGSICFASVLFYFSLRNQHYAFVKLHPCLSKSALCSLRRSVFPLVQKFIDFYFKLFDEKKFSFYILPVSDILNIVVKIPSLEENLSYFTAVEFLFEHD